MQTDRVLRFKADYHPALWGGETWAVSAHRSAPSVIADGPLAGRTLADVEPGFPLLIKTIDAKTRLSVQVHPNERTCRLTGGDPKTEMWCMLEDGFIYAGLVEGAGPRDVEAAVASGRFEELLVRHEAKAGEAFFIPGGLVHAIGDGVKLYEVQQSSDTTFRLYDWNRTDASGRARELHVAQSLQAIDYTLRAPVPVRDVACPFFSFRQVDVDGERTFSVDTGFAVLFAAAGSLTLDGLPVAAGESLLLRAGARVRLGGKAKIFVTT
jgi:mannose-6-phosphate isomerase